MSTVISKSSSVLVRPSSSEPMTKSGTTIKLSPLDKDNFPFVVLLVFEHPINDAANTIKSALSNALVHYYPFCGRVVAGAADGDASSYIDCSGDDGAVEFIAASAKPDCSLKEAGKLFARSSSSSSSPSLLDELAVFYPVGSYGPDDPLLSVQVTEFSCGGFVLGVTWSHAVADGVGIAQFLTAVGELARASASAAGELPPPSVVPVRWDEAVWSHPPVMNPGQEAVMMSLPDWFDPAKGHSFIKVLTPLPLVHLDVTIPWSFIGRVKAELPTCTMFEVVLAVLWRCRTRAIAAAGDDDRLSFLAFAVNVRKHLGAKDGYYGNCIMDKLASGVAVASMEIVDIVKLIKQAKDEIPEQLKQKDGGRDKQLVQQGLEGLDGGRYNMLLVSCWRGIGFEDADLGSGPPARIMCHLQGTPPVPSCIITCLRSSSKGSKGEEEEEGDGGAKVMAVCVKEEHADAFLAEIAKCT